MSNAAWRIRKRVVNLMRLPDLDPLASYTLSEVVKIIDEELEAEAERQFTRPISQQAEQSRMLKEDK